MTSMTSRVSSNQFTILKALSGKALAFNKAVQFNQAMFYSLVRRGFIELNLATEAFELTQDGTRAYDRYTHGNISNLLVANDPEERHERVVNRLMSEGRHKKPALHKAHNRKQAAA
jgi:hypothetical protein